MKFKILPIVGDASFRKFYRLILNKTSKIIVTAQKEKYKNLIAYSGINKYLRSKKILAPKLYAYNFSKGLIVIEDFGDFSYYKKILKKKNKFYLYKKIINQLLKIQTIKPKTKIRNINKTTHAIELYSNKHLFKESNLFFDWYLPLFFTNKKALSIKVKANKILLQLYNKLNFSNSYFVHRDFHAQNLMCVGKKIGIIDSQDALIGNPAYDLVSLIDDVRIKTPEKLKNRIYNYYVKKTPIIGKNNEAKFLQDFQILSVQRSLKIIGIFSRLYIRDKKKKYLNLIPYTWKLLELRMRSEIFSELKKIFDNNIYKSMKKNIHK